MDVSLEAQTKPLSTLSAFSYIPPRRMEPKEMSYYNKESQVPDVSMYDQLFHQAEGYDVKLHRDDRKHSKGRGLDIDREAYENGNPSMNLPQPEAEGAILKGHAVLPLLATVVFGLNAYTSVIEVTEPVPQRWGHHPTQHDLHIHILYSYPHGSTPYSVIIYDSNEKSRSVPVRSSSEYGQRAVPVLYQTGRQYARVACIKAEFFMKNGIIWNVAEGYGSVAPF